MRAYYSATFWPRVLRLGTQSVRFRPDSDPQSSIISSLPAEYSQPSESVADTAGTQKDLPAEEKLKIAWRYQTIPKTQGSFPWQPQIVSY